MPFLSSTAICRAEYDLHSRVLEIWFHDSDGPYPYFDVPAWKYHGLLSAPSAGAFFNAYIRDQHSIRRR